MGRTIQIRLTGIGERQARIAEGIGQFMSLMGDWVVPYAPWREASRIRGLGEVACDGVIADTLGASEVELASELPIVVVSGRRADCPCPRVTMDNLQAGRDVAHALLETGLREFAYVAMPNTHFSRLRCNGFAETVESAGRRCHVFDPSDLVRQPEGWDRANRALRQFLVELPKPTGVMAANDERAIFVVETASDIGLRVPDDLAVAGVDNTTVICTFSSPSLSSLDDNAQRIGYEAAALLERMMAGEPKPDHDLLLVPGKFIERRSTDTVFAQDPAIAKAIRFIRSHACDGIRVDDVLKVAGISRSSLQRGMRETIGRTPAREIRRVQIDRAKELLAETDWSIKRIAAATGHRDNRHLAHVFAAQVGQSPSGYRTHAKKTMA